MKITDMVKKYYFHDSGIAKVEFDPEKHEATLLIDFCNWMQDDYNDEEEENIVLKLLFRNVSGISGEQPLLDINRILDCVMAGNDQTVEFFIGRRGIANYSEEYIVLRIIAEDVIISQVGVGWYEPTNQESDK